MSWSSLELGASFVSRRSSLREITQQLTYCIYRYIAMRIQMAMQSILAVHRRWLQRFACILRLSAGLHEP